MKRLVFAIFLMVAVLSLASSSIILSSLSSLYYTRNPIDNLFKTSWLELEAFYRPLGDSNSYQDLSVTLRLPWDYITAAVTASYGGENLFERVQSGEGISSNFEIYGNIAAQFTSLIFAVTTPPIRVSVSEQKYSLAGNNAKIGVGLGSVKFEADYKRFKPKAVKSGGAAIYYINEDIVYLDESGVVVNNKIDWLNAKAGLFADAVGYDGRVVLDLGLDLNGIKAMQEENNESREEQNDELFKYIYATLEIEGKPLILGATYDKSGFLFSGGLNMFDMMKGWVEVVFDQEFKMEGFGVFAQLYF